MFEKQVTQSERRIRNSHVTSMHTGTPLGSNSNYQVYMCSGINITIDSTRARLDVHTKVQGYATHHPRAKRS